ncbi:MAG: LysE family translocator [Pseudomonadota bacterium]
MATDLNIDTLLALAGYAVASTWTPGPNNMMLASSGATFGWRATQPHAMGVAVGFPLMFFLVALGLGQVFEAAPMFRLALGWLGCGVMLWLAWRIATAAPPAAPDVSNNVGAATAGTRDAGGSGHRPLTFAGAAAFQWVNPKAWVMSIGVSAAFVSGRDPIGEAALGTLVFLGSGLTSAQAWALLGAGAGRLLGRGSRLRVFNVAMGLMLGVSALWLVVEPVG